MEKEHLTWRSFADPADHVYGPISKQWNFPATPTLYVIDHQGVIQRKWVGAPGEATIDAALEELVSVAERAVDGR